MLRAGWKSKWRRHVEHKNFRRIVIRVNEFKEWKDQEKAKEVMRKINNKESIIDKVPLSEITCKIYTGGGWSNNSWHLLKVPGYPDHYYSAPSDPFGERYNPYSSNAKEYSYVELPVPVKACYSVIQEWFWDTLHSFYNSEHNEDGDEVISYSISEFIEFFKVSIFTEDFSERMYNEDYTNIIGTIVKENIVFKIGLWSGVAYNPFTNRGGYVFQQRGDSYCREKDEDKSKEEKVCFQGTKEMQDSIEIAVEGWENTPVSYREFLFSLGKSILRRVIPFIHQEDPSLGVCPICGELKKLHSCRENSVFHCDDCCPMLVLSPEQKINKNDFVYFAKAGDTIKIGKSVQPLARVRSLRTANPTIEIIHVEYGGFDREQELHKLFKEDRLQREFFTFSSAIKTYLEENKEKNLLLYRDVELK